MRLRVRSGRGRRPGSRAVSLSGLRSEWARCAGKRCRHDKVSSGLSDRGRRQGVAARSRGGRHTDAITVRRAARPSRSTGSGRRCARWWAPCTPGRCLAGDGQPARRAAPKPGRPRRRCGNTAAIQHGARIRPRTGCGAPPITDTSSIAVSPHAARPVRPPGRRRRRRARRGRGARVVSCRNQRTRRVRAVVVRRRSPDR